MFRISPGACLRDKLVTLHLCLEMAKVCAQLLLFFCEGAALGCELLRLGLQVL